MEEELKLDQAVPTLTFEPFTETKKEAPAPQQEMPKPEPIYEEEALLSEQEKKQVEAFAEKIDITDSTAILQHLYFSMVQAHKKRSQIFLIKRLKMSDQKILARQEPCWQA